ncbi:MAG: ABC transporter permease [Caulobacteraceae bacterium]|nr:ABC transporter permease [Caulobacter sp.]
MTPLARSERVREAAPPVLTGLALIGLWEGACRLFAIPAFLFPAPSAVLRVFLTDAPTLLRALLSTLEVTVMAFALAALVGTLVAFVFVQSRAVERSLFPYAVMLQVTPVVAIAPLIIILVKDTRVALVVCAALVALFPVISNTTLGLRTVDPGLANLFALHKAGPLQTLVRLRIPSALPLFFAGLRISSGLALIGAVVAEFVAGTGGTGSGLAYEILQSGFQLDIPRMFAALFLITAAGVALFLLMAGLTRLALGDWHESERRPER